MHQQDIQFIKLAEQEGYSRWQYTGMVKSVKILRPGNGSELLYFKRQI